MIRFQSMILDAILPQANVHNHTTALMFAQQFYNKRFILKCERVRRRRRRCSNYRRKKIDCRGYRLKCIREKLTEQENVFSQTEPSSGIVYNGCVYQQLLYSLFSHCPFPSLSHSHGIILLAMRLGPFKSAENRPNNTVDFSRVAKRCVRFAFLFLGFNFAISIISQRFEMFRLHLKMHALWAVHIFD